MTPSNFHRQSVHPGANQVIHAVNQNPYCFVTRDEEGVILVDPVPVSHPLEKLIYTDYDTKTHIHTATLSPSQVKQLSKQLASILNVDTPIVNLSVCAGSSFLSIGFSVRPKLMGGSTIVPGDHAGLRVLFVSGINIAFTWNVEESGIKWPSWLTRPTY